MFRTSIAAIAASAAIVLGVTVGADARPSRGMLTCSNSQTMKIPLSELNKCALGGGVMKCSSTGYECCYDGGSFCEWTAYVTRPTAGADLVPPPGGNALPPRSGRPDIRPPAGPYSPPRTPPSRPPRFDAGKGPTMVAQPPRSTGPRVK
ncbi:MAG TPA: hypothetical protein VJZ74_04805 [Pseudolabrys sp.]|nr:hypothetical protein [Pseudolabrys sp.]